MSSNALPRRRSRASTAWWRTTMWFRRYLLHSDGFVLLALSLSAVALGLLFQVSPDWFPSPMLAVVVLVGGFLMGVRSLLMLDVVVAAVLLWELSPFTRETPPGAVAVVAATAGIVLLLARSRARLGVQGTRGDSMLVDLRDRLRANGEMPELPQGWAAEVALRSAGGASFSGDFLVATRSSDGRSLEIALVDVSGKGVDAGTRSLLLSGAFGGLLGSVPPDDFLAAANRYLIRQGWDEGFATVGHVVIDLESGEYVESVAGHPPAVQFLAGTGRWRVCDTSEGPLLGIFPDAKFVSARGRLHRGDALLLFTDGLVEVPGRDLSVGLDKLLGAAERLVTDGFQRGAHLLLDRVAASHNDDRAVVLVWRD